MSAHTRRQFLAAAGIGLGLAACKSKPKKPDATAIPASAMPMRKLGRTGVMVSAIGIGGFHIGNPSEAEAIRIVRMAIDHGVTFLDNCWDYHDGESERRMGKALEGGYRDKAFLMTKIDGRTKASAIEQIQSSLTRLRTDHLDLVQLHEVIRHEDPDRAFAPGGAIEALMEAKKQGKTRFIGFTGHKDPDIHLHMLETAKKAGFEFDTVQMPLNVMDAHFKSFEKSVLPVALERGIGVLGMKPLASGKILESKTVSADECLRYALSLPTSVVITGCDSIPVLEQALRVAKMFTPLSPQEKTALLARTAPLAGEGKSELYKTSTEHDSTSKHPQWLG